MANPKILVLLGSASDRETMEAMKPYLDYFGIAADFRISSAHRQPNQTAELARGAAQGYSLIIAGAGMAAHLAGVCAAHSRLPVIAVPLEGSTLGGMDALLSSVQMPAGVPVAAVSIGKAGAINAACLAARILALNSPAIASRLDEFQRGECRLPESSGQAKK
jgi:phosphoribosylaminoimidazole carboxylase PurE protein